MTKNNRSEIRPHSPIRINAGRPIENVMQKCSVLLNHSDMVWKIVASNHHQWNVERSHLRDRLATKGSKVFSNARFLSEASFFLSSINVRKFNFMFTQKIISNKRN